MSRYSRFRRYGRSAIRKGRRVYKWARANPKQAAAMAESALKGVKFIKGLVNSEMLKLDNGGSSAIDNVTSNSLIPLHAIAQGDGDSARTGNSIFARALNGNINFEKHASATYTYVRCMILMDTQQVGDTTPTVLTVLQSDWASHLNTATVGRFKVLYSKIVVLNSARPSVQIKYNKAMRHHIRYNSTASTDIQKGGIYMLLTSSESTNTPTVRYNLRLSYHDN